MLHVLNGDSTLALLKQSTVKGDFLVWKEMLMEGPTPEVKTGGLDWKGRSVYLKNSFGIDPKSYLSGIQRFFKTLNRAAETDSEVTFWFEEDFFCQINLIYLIAHLPAPLLRRGRAFVICPEKPLSIRLASSMDRLYAARTPLDPAIVTLSKKVWQAHSLSTTKGWESLLTWAQASKGFAAWPLLQRGLRCQLGRRPAPNGGLNALEKGMLKAVSEGPVSFPQFFRRTWMDPEIRPLGLSERQIARYALDFSAQGLPLLKIEGRGSSPTPGKRPVTAAWKLSLSTEGKAIFAPTKASVKSTRPVTHKPSKPKARSGSKKK